MCGRPFSLPADFLKSFHLSSTNNGLGRCIISASFKCRSQLLGGRPALKLCKMNKCINRQRRNGTPIHDGTLLEISADSIHRLVKATGNVDEIL